jgi:hypothetical protein
LTGQFPNQYRRLAPRFGFAWQPVEKTVVRGGFGKFYENLNGLNYRNAVVSNGLLTQQASVSLNYDPTLAPNQQQAVFPNQVSDPSLFSQSDISLVDPHFRFAYILQGSLQIEREILPDTVVTIGTTWTHGVHLEASSAYDLNLNPLTGATTYTLCPPDALDASQCAGGRSVVLPTMDSNLLTDGRLTSNFGQINALISPGVNNYNSLFIQGQRRFRHGLAFQAAYTFSKNLMSRGVDFNNQFDFSNTHAPYLLDQRHRLSIAGVYSPAFATNLHPGFLKAALSDWSLSTVLQFASGRPYAALIDLACTTPNSRLDSDSCLAYTTVNNEPIPASNSINNTAALQSTANSALGINAGSPSPLAGLDSFYGPWTEQIDFGLTRRFKLTERHALTLQAQVFNVMNHPNYYVQNGTGAAPIQYTPFGTNCGDGKSANQQCFLVPSPTFGQLQVINALDGPRVMQFALKWTF